MPTGAQLSEVAQWLGLASATALQHSFPQLYRPGARSKRWGLSLDGSLVTHLATLDAELIGPAGSAQTRMIGSVCTKPEHRGQGLAGRLLESEIRRAQLAGVDALLLWSDIPEYYARFGFVPAGIQYTLPLIAPTQDPYPSGKVRRAKIADLPAILALHQAKPLRIQRTLDDLGRQLTAAPMQTWVLERQARVDAYACYGRGADFPGWWHEVGGSDSDLARLIGKAMWVGGLPSATLLLPHYRAAAWGIDPTGAMPAGLRLALNERGRQPLFVDGLDSV